MSGEFTYPGVYIKELQSPVHTISGVQTSITAFVGVAARGLNDEPVTIFSPADYERAFGGDGSLPLDRAVSLFYQNGGGEAIVVRVVVAGTAASSVTLTFPDINKRQVISAGSSGAWGDKLEISVDQTNIPAAQKTTLYNLTIADKGTSVVERYVGVSTDPASPRSLVRTLAASSLIKAGPLTDVAPGDPPPVGPHEDITLPLAQTVSGLQFQGGGGAAQPTDADIKGDAAAQTGIYALTKHDTFFNLLVLTPPPDATDVTPGTLGEAAKFARDHRAMLIADAPKAWTGVALAVQGRDAFFDKFGKNAPNVAVYFPRLVLSDPKGGEIQDVGPSAAVAGLYASTDAERGVWKAPAGIAVQMSGISKLSLRMSDQENGLLNPVAVNCLRALPVVGNVIWGARTAAGDDFSGSQWKYIPIRRLALYIEESLYRGTQWVVFEPNDEPLWAQVRLNVGAFMHTLFRQGAFQGTTAKDAYFVKCDSDSNPQVDIDNGILNVIVGFAPLKPAEFVVIKIQQIIGHIDV